MTSPNCPVTVVEAVLPLLGWSTDTISVDYSSSRRSTTIDKRSDDKVECPHTYLIFIPGNPGCVGWYKSDLVEFISRLGPGFAARAVSYAGHSSDESLVNIEKIETSADKDVSVPWTVNGQVKHKIAFVDHILCEHKRLQPGRVTEHGSPRFIFLSHSIGSHMVERVCMLRPDILGRTIGLVHLMPFTRMKALNKDQRILNWGAARPEVLIGIAKGLTHILRTIPEHFVDALAKSTFEDDDGRKLAVSLLRQPWYTKNFFELGTEEIRDVPETVDTCALRLIGRQCPISMLYVGKDQWAPEFHQNELKELQSIGIIPQNISIKYLPELRHDYVSYDHMVPKAVDWCYESIHRALKASPRVPVSRL